MLHPPLSQSLAQVLQAEPHTDLTFNYLIKRTEERGLFLILILFSLPFSTPIPLFGLSNILGFVMVTLSLRLALAKPPFLPRFIGDRKLPPQTLEKVLGASVKFLRFLEKWVKPRGTDWLTWPAAKFCNALLLTFMCFLLMLPIPPVIPFSNAFPSYAIILLAASMMEEDGIMIWFAYAAAIGTVIYLGSATKVMIEFFSPYVHSLIDWVQKMI